MKLLKVIKPEGTSLYVSASSNDLVLTKIPFESLLKIEKDDFNSFIECRYISSINGVYTELIGYVLKDDVKIIPEDKIELSEVERGYLSHLLKYASEELFVYSSKFLENHNINLEDVDQFILDLNKKILGVEE